MKTKMRRAFSDFSQVSVRSIIRTFSFATFSHSAFLELVDPSDHVVPTAGQSKCKCYANGKEFAKLSFTSASKGKRSWEQNKSTIARKPTKIMRSDVKIGVIQQGRSECR